MQTSDEEFYAVFRAIKEMVDLDRVEELASYVENNGIDVVKLKKHNGINLIGEVCLTVSKYDAPSKLVARIPTDARWLKVIRSLISLSVPMEPIVIREDGINMDAFSYLTYYAFFGDRGRAPDFYMSTLEHFLKHGYNLDGLSFPKGRPNGGTYSVPLIEFICTYQRAKVHHIELFVNYGVTIPDEYLQLIRLKEGIPILDYLQKKEIDLLKEQHKLEIQRIRDELYRPDGPGFGLAKNRFENNAKQL